MAEKRAKMLARLKAMRRKFGLGEFKRKARTRVAKRVGGIRMARRRRGRRAFARRSVSRMGGSGMLMNGLFPVSGIIAKALVGAGAATYQEKILPQMIPFQSEAVGFVVGGVPGAAGAFGRTLAKSAMGIASTGGSASYGGY